MMEMTDFSLKELLASVFADVAYGSTGETALVQTHCLYPDGSNATVRIVRCGASLWKISDDYAGLDVVRNHFLNVSDRSLKIRAKKISEMTDVGYDDGEWHLTATSFEQIVGCVLGVANASQQWVGRMFGEHKTSASDIVEHKLWNSLKKVFDEKMIERSPIMVGRSKPHEMSALLTLPSRKRIAFEAVVPHPGSIYSAYTKMMDVSSGEGRPDHMKLVIDSDAGWGSGDLALLLSAGAELWDLSRNSEEGMRALA